MTIIMANELNQGHYSCEECSATCTFEAFQMCQLESELCPTFIALKTGIIVDKRFTDVDPNFPSEFSFTHTREGQPK